MNVIETKVGSGNPAAGLALPDALSRLREVMAAFPPLEAHTPGTRLDEAEVYFPESHATALDPDRTLVVGNRGMGKSFWASALVKPETRAKIVSAYLASRPHQSRLEVKYAFADGEASQGGFPRETLTRLYEQGVQPEHIWRAIILPDIAEHIPNPLPESVRSVLVRERLAERVAWIRSNPDQVRDLMRKGNAALETNRGKLLFIFDQLEQLAHEGKARTALARGIFQLALALKSYPALRAKIFIRPDYYNDERLFEFSDASKVKGDAVSLDWRPVDLYGLLFSRLLREAPEAVHRVAREAELDVFQDRELTIHLPAGLKTDEELQARLFAVVAGATMGAGPKRGRPYTWLISHLSDANNQVSPRTLMRALTFAANHHPAPPTQAIDHHGIHEGIRQASQNRIDDLKEDYPWVPPALQALTGLLVPCSPEDLMDRWQNVALWERLKERVPSFQQPGWLLSSAPLAEASQELLASMEAIAVIEHRRTTGKVDVPDIFRLPNNIKRKGGITPQQRRQIRGPLGQAPRG